MRSCWTEWYFITESNIGRNIILPFPCLHLGTCHEFKNELIVKNRIMNKKCAKNSSQRAVRCVSKWISVYACVRARDNTYYIQVCACMYACVRDTHVQCVFELLTSFVCVFRLLYYALFIIHLRKERIDWYSHNFVIKFYYNTISGNRVIQCRVTSI